MLSNIHIIEISQIISDSRSHLLACGVLDYTQLGLSRLGYDVLLAGVLSDMTEVWLRDQGCNLNAAARVLATDELWLYKILCNVYRNNSIVCSECSVVYFDVHIVNNSMHLILRRSVLQSNTIPNDSIDKGA